MSVLLFGLEITDATYDELLSLISSAYSGKNRLLITYITQHVANNICSDASLLDCYRKFHVRHPDGIGIWLASKAIYGKNGLSNRFTGSDLYPLLLSDAKRNGKKIFFFGDTRETLETLRERVEPELVAGTASGFEFDTKEVIDQINKSEADILFVGLGSPLQEQWIIAHSVSLNVPVIIAVGEGIRIAAGIKKRGPLWMQRIGLEWLVRLCTQPLRLWKRYIIGIPVFIIRVIKEKSNLR
jgi:exopolysaccharide biosynthesis WecB/TagA/CpsF family protein